MSKSIVAGEVVKILDIHPGSNWGNSSYRGRLIGMEVKLLEIDTTTLGGGWKYIRFFDTIDKWETVIRGVKVRRVKP